MMAKFVQYANYGGPEVLEIVTGDVPIPKPGEVIVEVRAAGVNPVDWMLRDGWGSNGPLEIERRAGLDGAGVVVALDPDVMRWEIGDEVIVCGADGTFATHVAVEADSLVAKPAGISWATAAALGITIPTAYQALKSLHVGPEDRLLIHGGSGLIGQVSIQLARRWGATVVATGSTRNHSRIAAFGATPVAYGGGLLERLREAESSGYTVILDVGPELRETLDVSISLRPDRTRIGTVISGPAADELGVEAYGGGSARSLTSQQLALRAEAISVVLPLIEAGEIEIEIGRIYPLSAVAEAERASKAYEVRGKIILVP